MTEEIEEEKEKEETPYIVQNWVTSSTGRKIYCKPLHSSKHNRIVKIIEDKHRDAGKPVDIPTYLVPVEGNDDETHEHDETTLEVKNNLEETEENKKNWAAYTLAYNEMRVEANEVILKWLCVEGIDFKKSSKDFAKWKKSQEFINILPVGENEQEFAYIRDNLIVTTNHSTTSDILSDFMLTIENCYILAMEGPTSEMVALARAGFRGDVSE